MSTPATEVAAVVATVKADVSKAKAFENKVFAFLQAHYTKGVALAVGFAASHFGVVGLIFKAL
jgi:hypothetical protein